MDLKKDLREFRIGDAIINLEDESDNNIYIIRYILGDKLVVKHKYLNFDFPVRKQNAIKCPELIQLLF